MEEIYRVYHKHKEQEFKIIDTPDVFKIYHNGTFGWYQCGKAVSLENAKEVIKRYLKKI
jgi:hypothetical protein